LSKFERSPGKSLHSLGKGGDNNKEEDWSTKESEDL